ncbi:MAG: HDIG domain-containing metalloprotein [Symbiobacteriia bacterium]
MEISRPAALALLREYTQSPHLIKHALAVEAAMRHYAGIYGEDAERWGFIGLLHDFDYERYPELTDHARVGADILRQQGVPEDIAYAICAHNDATGVPRTHLVDKALFAVDEISGFVTAVAMVKPNKSVAEVDVRSVRKKMKDKAFARAVSREDLERGAAELELELDAHIANIIAALQAAAGELGLAGSGQTATA